MTYAMIMDGGLLIVGGLLVIGALLLAGVAAHILSIIPKIFKR
jgi:hypothetical protein